MKAYRYGDRNLVVNGDFESAGHPFQSDYLYVGPKANALFPEGVYTMVTNAKNQHIYFKSHQEHTINDGKGHYLAVNGKMDPGAIVWEQKITGRAPHTPHIFTAWVVTLKADVFPDRAVLQFSINDSLVGNPFYAPYPDTREWARFFVEWNSEKSTTATIKIHNLNTGADQRFWDR